MLSDFVCDVQCDEFVDDRISDIPVDASLDWLDDFRCIPRISLRTLKYTWKCSSAIGSDGKSSPALISGTMPRLVASDILSVSVSDIVGSMATTPKSAPMPKWFTANEIVESVSVSVIDNNEVSSEMALREELFCRLIASGCLVLPSTFDDICGTPCPLDTIELDLMAELYAVDCLKIEKVLK